MEVLSQNTLGYCTHILYGLRLHLHSWDIKEAIFYITGGNEEEVVRHIKLSCNTHWKNELIKKKIISKSYKVITIRYFKGVEIFEQNFNETEEEFLSKFNDHNSPICINLTYDFLNPANDATFEKILLKKKAKFKLFGFSLLNK
jgi:hypothetical protein